LDALLLRLYAQSAQRGCAFDINQDSDVASNTFQLSEILLALLYSVEKKFDRSQQKSLGMTTGWAA
jgi:hypothetical protein